MDRHAEGDDAAFGELYDLLAPRLMAYFSRHLQGREQAEDLVQHTLLNMHRARAHFVRGSDVVPWAFAIGRRLLIDTQRRQKNEVLFETDEESRRALDSRVERGERPDAAAARTFTPLGATARCVRTRAARRALDRRSREGAGHDNRRREAAYASRL
jgi:RNA polymerase sigma-70 factor (ECF subfamily)